MFGHYSKPGTSLQDTGIKGPKPAKLRLLVTLTLPHFLLCVILYFCKNLNFGVSLKFDSLPISKLVTFLQLLYSLLFNKLKK